MTGWVITVENDAGGQLLALSVENDRALRDAALDLALLVLKAARHHPVSNGAVLRLLLRP